MPETPSNTMSGWSRPSKQHLNLASILAVLQDISPAAILLGITLNVLDTVSTGLLVFPSSENGSTTFSGLQTQAMSLYVMSTIFSQLAMTLGGSLFPGALGSMLIEVLPFLRNIASSIQDRIGEGDPAILPTVMAAYALTSFLVAFVFIALGLLKCGRLVAYFPGTVLTGAIGAVGVSLFILGLELTLPASSDHLSLGTAGHVLFNQTHLPLLVASVFAALFISVSVRSSFLSKMTRGFTEHALYVPLFCFFIAGLFWVIAAGTKHANADGLDALRSAGWLFTVEKSHRDTGYDWNYWALFDFSLVKWNAMTAAIQDIVLLIVIAVISLPIFIPAMALTLDIPSYNMNWEFFGHGISNLLAGVAGTVPNLVVLTNSKFFTLAGGGRIEALIVTAFTVALFFVSSYLLPYIPTILAATLVLFLGIELMIEALWDAPQSLLIWEWAVVLGTVIACTFIGFAPGVGIGIGMALLVQLWWCNFESRPTIFNLARRPGRRAIAAKNDDRRKSTVISQVDADFYDSSSTLEAQSLPTPTKNRSAISSTENLHAATAQPVIIRLTGYVSFFIISTIEATMKSALKTGNSMIVDFTHATRVETSVAQMLKRQAEMFSISSFTGTLSFAGVLPDSGLLADLKRGGMDCVCMDALQASSASPHFADGATPFFDELDGALNWHARLEDSASKPESHDEKAFELLKRVLPEALVLEAMSSLPYTSQPHQSRLESAGFRLCKRKLGEALILTPSRKQVYFVLSGSLFAESCSEREEHGRSWSRRSFLDNVTGVLKTLPSLWRKRKGTVDMDEKLEGVKLSASSTDRFIRAGTLFGLGDLALAGDGLVKATVVEDECWMLEAETWNVVGLSWLASLAADVEERQYATYHNGPPRIGELNFSQL